MPALLLRHKLNSRIDDLDLNLEDFVSRVNADVVNKAGQPWPLATPALSPSVLTAKLAATCAEPALYAEFANASASIAEAYEAREFSRAIRGSWRLADKGQPLCGRQGSWVIAKQEGADADCKAVCSVGINLFRVLMACLKPVMPQLAERAEAFLGETLTWDGIAALWSTTASLSFKALFSRIGSAKGGCHGGSVQEDLAKEQSKKPAGPWWTIPSARPSPTTTLPRLTCGWR